MLEGLLHRNNARGEDAVFKFDLTDVTYKGIDQSFALSLRYVPDRDVLPLEGFRLWHQNIQSITEWAQAEDVISEILKGFYDEVLPRWMDISLSFKDTNGLLQTLRMSKSQPKFSLSDPLEKMIYSQQCT